jgi:hypothetical protein
MILKNLKCAFSAPIFFSWTLTVTGTSTVSAASSGVHICLASSHMPSIALPLSSITSTDCTTAPWNLISVKPRSGPGSKISSPVGTALIEPVI